jgi:hypothetical protein
MLLSLQALKKAGVTEVVLAINYRPEVSTVGLGICRELNMCLRMHTGG